MAGRALRFYGKAMATVADYAVGDPGRFSFHSGVYDRETSIPILVLRTRHLLNGGIYSTKKPSRCELGK